MQHSLSKKRQGDNALPLRYALYTRKSSEEDERQTQSIQSQIERSHELANHKG